VAWKPLAHIVEQCGFVVAATPQRSPRHSSPSRPWRVLPYPILRRVSSTSTSSAAPALAPVRCAGCCRPALGAHVHHPGEACLPPGGAGVLRRARFRGAGAEMPLVFPIRAFFVGHRRDLRCGRRLSLKLFDSVQCILVKRNGDPIIKLWVIRLPWFDGPGSDNVNRLFGLSCGKFPSYIIRRASECSEWIQRTD